ncbi:MAG: serine O-acetyltransferase EpsC [Bacillota bacterium]|nr:serine O-acetyltransferase EpsC [Bacillota bacterium]
MKFINKLKYDLQRAVEVDPAARNKLEVFLLYPYIKALIIHSFTHFLYNKKMFFLSRLISNFGRFLTGIEIHPGAEIKEGLFIDHGIGVVIGETAVIGKNVHMYHGVTLGGTGKERGIRHPTVEDNVVIGAGAILLGDIIIGKGTKVGANAVVLESTNPYSTVVGVKAKEVKKRG